MRARGKICRTGWRIVAIVRVEHGAKMIDGVAKRVRICRKICRKNQHQFTHFYHFPISVIFSPPYILGFQKWWEWKNGRNVFFIVVFFDDMMEHIVESMSPSYKTLIHADRWESTFLFIIVVIFVITETVARLDYLCAGYAVICYQLPVTRLLGSYVQFSSGDPVVKIISEPLCHFLFTKPISADSQSFFS